MSKHLEDFVKNNREDFDNYEPGPVVWHNIQQQLKKPAGKQGILISMKTLRWSAAAAVIMLLGAGVWYYMQHKAPTKQENMAQEVKKNPAASNDLPQVAKQEPAKETPVLPEQVQPNKINNDTPLADNADADRNEEMIHYTRLVELKQKQISRIQKEEPLLYRQFAGDFNRLDSTFHILKKQLPVNPNREQILEAMIQNLQYQEALLNQQLNIIKKINHTKKQAYEKAYRSI
jgi:hypothetical protein